MDRILEKAAVTGLTIKSMEHTVQINFIVGFYYILGMQSKSGLQLARCSQAGLQQLKWIQ